jgi:hypothetical protein
MRSRAFDQLLAPLLRAPRRDGDEKRGEDGEPVVDLSDPLTLAELETEQDCVARLVATAAARVPG